MILRFLLLFLVPLIALWGESVDCNTNGKSYEITATKHTRINTETNGHYNLGYLQSYDEFDHEQKLLFFEKEALSKRPHKNWTFGIGTKLLYSDIGLRSGGGSILALPIKAEAFYHIPLQRQLYVALTYYYAPGFLVVSDHFNGYTESRIEVTLAITRNTKAYVGGKNILLMQNSGGSYEVANSGFVGVRYLF